MYHVNYSLYGRPFFFVPNSLSHTGTYSPMVSLTASSECYSCTQGGLSNTLQVLHYQFYSDFLILMILSMKALEGGGGVQIYKIHIALLFHVSWYTGQLLIFQALSAWVETQQFPALVQLVITALSPLPPQHHIPVQVVPIPQQPILLPAMSAPRALQVWRNFFI